MAKEKSSGSSSGRVDTDRDARSGRLVDGASGHGDAVPSRTSPKSVKVIKDSATTYRDALKRLVDR